MSDTAASGKAFRLRLRAYLGIAACAAGFLSIHRVGSDLYFGYRMRFRMPDERMLSHGELAFLYYGLIVGVPSILIGVWGLLAAETAWPTALRGVRRVFSRLAPSRNPRAAAVLGFAAAGAGIVATRLLVFHDRVVTNDEFYYLFDAKLLRSHRLFLPISPLLGRFFPGYQAVLWNGRFFSKYFVGHAAILAAGLKAGIGVWIVPLLSVLALLPLAAFVRRAFGSRVAAATLLLLAISPFYVLTGATTLSQPAVVFFFSCFLFLWALYRSAEGRRRFAIAVGLGFAATAMGVTRPVSAVGLVVPILVFEVARGFRARRPRQVIDLVAFSTPALVGIGLLLWVNFQQNGNALRSAYALRGFPLDRLMSLAHPDDWRRLVENVAITWGRLNWAQFGWPVSLLFLPFAFGRPLARVLGASCLGFFLANHLTPSPGIDPVGPEHFAELAPLLAVLTALGIVGLFEAKPERSGLLQSLLFLLVTFEATIFLPQRLPRLEAYVRQANRVSILAERARLHRAVVFANRVPFPWLSVKPDVAGRRFYPWPRTTGEPQTDASLLRLRMSDNGSGFGEYGDDNFPVPDPDLRDDVLYLIDDGPGDVIAIDRLPGRAAFVLAFVSPGRLELHSLERVPDGVVVDPRVLAFTSATDPDVIGP